MIATIIRWSVANRLLVVVAALALALAGSISVPATKRGSAWSDVMAETRRVRGAVRG